MPQGHILVVDDERPIGQLVQRSLTRLGHRVVFLDQPEEALELLKHEAFDLVVTDLRMPGIDGIEFLSRSKRIRPGCEVLLMTGFASVETALEALKRGAIDYIQKPFSVERDLAPIIDRILSAPAGSGPVDDPVAAA
ncbi:MAG: response regulator, partial [Myxococcota bacterium]